VNGETLNGETYVVSVNEFSATCNWQVVGVQVEQNQCKDRALRKAIETVSRTVSEIFSVKEWRNLETGHRGRSSSLKMAPFDRSHTTF